MENIEWIKTSDKLPERDFKDKIFPDISDAVIASNGESIFIATYNHKYNYWEDGHDEMFDVTHWMPLPELPR